MDADTIMAILMLAVFTSPALFLIAWLALEIVWLEISKGPGDGDK